MVQLDRPADSKEASCRASPTATRAGAGRAQHALGFRMPAEWEPHERCIMGWPTQIRIGSVWNEHYLLAMASYAAVAHAIARFEPVLMLARPGEGGVARSYLGRDVEVVEMPIDDSWLRDSGPIFVTRPDGTLAMSDFTFNSWGEKYRALRQRRRHRPTARRALRRGAVRRPDGPRGGRHHRRRRGHADHHRELPAAPVPQSRPDQGRDDADPQGLPRRGEGHLAHLGARTRRGSRHRRARGRRRRVRRAGQGPAAHGARPAAPRLREPAREPPRASRRPTRAAASSR